MGLLRRRSGLAGRRRLKSRFQVSSAGGRSGAGELAAGREPDIWLHSPSFFQFTRASSAANAFVCASQRSQQQPTKRGIERAIHLAGYRSDEQPVIQQVGVPGTPIQGAALAAWRDAAAERTSRYRDR